MDSIERPSIQEPGTRSLVLALLSMGIAVALFELAAMYFLSQRFSDHGAYLLYVQMPTLAVGFYCGVQVGRSGIRNAAWKCARAMLTLAVVLSILTVAVAHPI